MKPMQRTQSPTAGQSGAGAKAVTGIDLAWVQCKGYRCLAYSDAAGRWVNFYTGEVLNEAIRVLN